MKGDPRKCFIGEAHKVLQWQLRVPKTKILRQRRKILLKCLKYLLNG